jgi:nicotinate-nucleotide--dimethylbenzimidazole phosphoribosyltransferase
MNLNACLQSIQPADTTRRGQIQAHLDNLTKPQGSLGRLESIAMQYVLATGQAKPELAKKRICCFAGDHGVADEGVSAFPKAVTPQMVLNMLAGGAAINVLSRHAGAELCIVDMGVDFDFQGAKGLIDCKVARGTRNMAKGPAMTIEETVRALEAGIRMAETAAAEKVNLLGTGDMGIANTTPATALMSAWLKLPVELITGRGTGLDNAGVQHKQRIIQQALTMDTLAALGGFEIAGIAGLILGGAAHRIPVVVDGFISSAGALAALRLCPAVQDYIFFSHLSAEQGHRAFAEAMKVEPILSLELRLGEGTGGALAMNVIEGAIRIYNEMATFTSASVSNKE